MGKYHCTIDLLFDWFGISCMPTDNVCFYLQNRVIQISQTRGQQYSDTSPFSIPWTSVSTSCLCLYQQQLKLLQSQMLKFDFKADHDSKLLKTTLPWQSVISMTTFNIMTLSIARNKKMKLCCVSLLLSKKQHRKVTLSIKIVVFLCWVTLMPNVG